MSFSEQSKSKIQEAVFALEEKGWWALVFLRSLFGLVLEERGCERLSCLTVCPTLSKSRGQYSTSFFKYLMRALN